jgi:hypothetical protein
MTAYSVVSFREIDVVNRTYRTLIRPGRFSWDYVRDGDFTTVKILFIGMSVLPGRTRRYPALA